MSPFPTVLSGNTLKMARESRGLAWRRRREHNLGYAGIAALGIDGEGKLQIGASGPVCSGESRSTDKRIAKLTRPLRFTTIRPNTDWDRRFEAVIDPSRTHSTLRWQRCPRLSHAVVANAENSSLGE